MLSNTRRPKAFRSARPREAWVCPLPWAIFTALPKKAPDGDLRKSQIAGRLQGKADVIAHLHEGLFRQFRQLGPQVRLALAPGAEDDLPQPHGLGHLESGRDGGPVGLMGKRLHQAGGAQNRDAAQNPQPRVQGVAGQFLAPGHEDFHPQAQGLAGKNLLPHQIRGCGGSSAGAPG